MIRLCSRVLLCVLMLPMLVACQTGFSAAKVQRMAILDAQEQDALLAEYAHTQNPRLLTKTFKLTPVIAAVYRGPELIPDMVANGVDVNYQVPVADDKLVFYSEPTTALNTALFLDAPQHLAVMKVLLEAGADPNLLKPLCELPYTLFMMKDDAGLIEMAALLMKYGADPSLKCGNEPIAEQVHRRGLVDFAEFLRDAQRSSLDLAIANYENREQRLAQEKRKREAAEAERQRQMQLAREIRQEKKAAIAQTFRENADLNAALSSLKESARPCFTLGSVSSEVNEFNCMGWIEGEGYSSPSCERYQEQLADMIDQQRDQFCPPYKKQRQQLANLFGTNASIADDVIQKALSGTENIADIESQYRSEIRRMQTIRDREARSERAEEDRRYQQGMYNFAKYIEQSVGSKTVADQIIEQSVADTQRTLFAIDSAQKMAKINADLEAINNRLKAIETTPTVKPVVSSQLSHQASNSVSGRAATSTPEKTACVAQSESKGPMNNVPERYCQYVFSDNTDTVKLDWSDYSNQFNEESGSLQQAQNNIQLPLLKKAKQVCEGRGYKRVHHSETFEFNQVAHQVTDCRENTRMESTFHLCVGTASFICAR